MSFIISCFVLLNKTICGQSSLEPVLKNALTEAFQDVYKNKIPPSDSIHFWIKSAVTSSSSGDSLKACHNYTKGFVYTIYQNQVIKADLVEWEGRLHRVFSIDDLKSFYQLCSNYFSDASQFYKIKKNIKLYVRSSFYWASCSIKAGMPRELLIKLKSDLDSLIITNQEMDLPNELSDYYEYIGSMLKNNHFSEREDAFLKSINISKRYNKGSGLGKKFSILGDFYRNANDYNKAIEMYKNSLNYISVPITLVRAYMNISVFYFYKNSLDSAIMFAERAVNLSTRYPGPYTINHLQRISELYLLNGEVNKATNTLREALNYVKQEEDKKKFFTLTVFKSNIYQTLAVIYDQNGDVNKSQEFYRKAISVLENPGDMNALETIDRMLLYSNLSDIYTHLGNWRKALYYEMENLTQNLKLYNNSNNKLLTIDYRIASIYLNLNKPDSALYYLKAARVIKEKQFMENLRISSGINFLMGTIYFHKGIYDTSRIFLLNAIDDFSKIGFSEYVSESYYMIGQSYYNEGKFREAAYAFHSSLTLFPCSNEKDLFSPLSDINKRIPTAKQFLYIKESAKSLYHSYLTVKDKNYLTNAYYLYQRCISMFEKIRMSASRVSKIDIAEDAFEIFDSAIKICFELYKETGSEEYLENAFSISEKSKIAMLKDEIRKARALKSGNVPDTLVNKERQLTGNIEFYNRLLLDEYQKEKPDSNSINILADKIFTLNYEYDLLMEKLSQTYPGYFEINNTIENLPLKQIMQNIDTNKCVVEYFLSPENLSIYTIKRTGFSAHIFSLNTSIASSVSTLYNLIRKRINLIRDKNRKQFISCSNTLYQILIKPVEKEISDKDLIIIPSGSLFYLPFEVLLRDSAVKDYNELDYFLRDYNISYAYSLSLLNKEESMGYQKYFLGFAPSFSNADNNNLPYASAEVEGISEIFKKFNLSTGIKNNINTTKSEFISDIYTGSYKYLHIATHGITHKQNPELSGLAFSDSGSGQNENNILYYDEIYNLNINANLVVLSACESGIGKLYNTEGMISLARGFIYSGVPNILFSLWKISDKNTLPLMEDFYTNTLKGDNYSAALRKAKLKMVENAYTASPDIWSSFILLGK